MKRTINCNKITNELILEIKESFHAFKSDRDYLDKIQVLTAEEGSNGKRTWINLFTKEKGEYRLNDENINLMIRNKKLPGETEEKFKNKILNSIRITYTGLEYNDKGLPSKTKKNIKGKEWVEIRKVQIKLPPCDAATASSLLALVQGQEYSLTYFDPLTGGQNTITAYTSNSSADCYSGVLYNGLWQGVGFNAIEVGGEG